MTQAQGWRASQIIGATAIIALGLAACAETDGDGGGDDEGSSDPIAVGTTDVIFSLDPAGSYDNGSFAVHNQVCHGSRVV